MNMNQKLPEHLAITIAAAIAIPAMNITTLAIADSLRPVSGPSPFASCPFGGPGTNYVNAEVEPQVAINPIHPNNIVGVWQQDRWKNGGAHGLVAAVSHNGGRTWTNTFAHFSSCSGGTEANGGNYDRASDPWVSFAPNGAVYQISLSTRALLDSAGRNIPSAISAILVSKSTDGGDTWSEPTTLTKDTLPIVNDKESITADPTNSQYVYAVWDRPNLPSDYADFNAFHTSGYRGNIYFSRTTNGGVSWEPARAIFDPTTNLFTVGHQIVVLPDGHGTLVDVFNLMKGSGSQPPQAGKFFQAIIRSTDRGVTWLAPIIASTEQAVPVVDPDTGHPVRTGSGLPDIAVDSNNGYLYVVWEDGRFSDLDHADIAFMVSKDGGNTWTEPVKINKTTNQAAAFTPSVHVAANGTVGVTYYDFRNNTPDSGLPTDYWLISCLPGADCTAQENWSESHIAGPFDMEKAPVARGYFLGDYQALTSIGSTFYSFFVQTNSKDTSPPTNPTDVFGTSVP